MSENGRFTTAEAERSFSEEQHKFDGALGINLKGKRQGPFISRPRTAVPAAERILRYMREHVGLALQTDSIAENFKDMNMGTLANAMGRLCRSGILIRVGSGRSGTYKLPRDERSIDELMKVYRAYVVHEKKMPRKPKKLKQQQLKKIKSIVEIPIEGKLLHVLVEGHIKVTFSWV